LGLRVLLGGFGVVPELRSSGLTHRGLVCLLFLLLALLILFIVVVEQPRELEHLLGLLGARSTDLGDL